METMATIWFVLLMICISMCGYYLYKRMTCMREIVVLQQKQINDLYESVERLTKYEDDNK